MNPNKFKVSDGDTVHWLPTPNTLEEAQAVAAKHGFKGEVLPRGDYVEPEDTHSALLKKMVEVYTEAARRSGVSSALIELGPYIVLSEAHKGAQAFIDHAQMVKSTLSGLSVAEIVAYTVGDWPE